MVENYTLEKFLDGCREKIKERPAPKDCVETLVPSMYRLLQGDRSFLRPEHLQSNPEHYARNAIYIEEGIMSLYSLIWLPGQWTPIHDHGTWGVIGVLEGTLQENSFIRIDEQAKDAMGDIDLAFGNVTLLTPGTITSFVPNPDHIHKTGNSDKVHRLVSLHLYGRAMTGYHEYDREQRTRTWKEYELGDGMS